MRTTLRHFAVEFVGTFALVFVGGGAIMMTQLTNSTAGLVTVALAHGVILGVMVSATMYLSGGQFNPAVTIGLLTTRRISLSTGGVYIAGQLAGGVIAAMALKGTMPTELVSATHAGGQSVASSVSTMQAIVLEAIATFFLMFVIYGTAVYTVSPKLGGLTIGLTIAADIMAIGPLTGASMNPARSFGPALVSGIWEAQAIYWIGPILGAILAALVWEYVLLEKPGA